MICTKCNHDKPLSEFAKNSTRKKGYSSACKECINLWHKAYRQKMKSDIEYTKKRNEKSKLYHKLHYYEKDKDRYMRRHYWTLEMYEKQCKVQKGKCAICGKAKRLCGDHDHITKQPRELLCISCNLRLGYFENKNSKKPFLDYLKKWGSIQQSGGQ